MEENIMDDKHLGMVVEEDNQVLIAFKPETIKLISDTLGISEGDVVEINPTDDSISITKLQ
ncbi:MAG TPA: hypothetical protein DCX27_19220 [Balneola sp.]|nr:hypothetical protein [Balneola sp.]|tara:strand:- start:291 stop:473 length:183 start_codon:yes stop_codon:yes gene_type:complete